MLQGLVHERAWEWSCFRKYIWKVWLAWISWSMFIWKSVVLFILPVALLVISMNTLQGQENHFKLLHFLLKHTHSDHLSNCCKQLWLLFGGLVSLHCMAATCYMELAESQNRGHLHFDAQLSLRTSKVCVDVTIIASQVQWWHKIFTPMFLLTLLWVYFLILEHWLPMDRISCGLASTSWAL